MVALAHAFVILSAEDADAPALPGVATCSKTDAWDDGGFALGRAAAERGAVWCDRPYWTGNPEPEWLASRCDAAIVAGAWAQVGNELNLPEEGFYGGPEGYFALEDAVRELVDDPDMLLAMPPSPGLAGWQAWVRPGGHHACHAYGTADQMRAIVQWYLDNTTGLVFVTECNFGAGQACDLDAWATGELPRFLDWCASEPRVLMAAYFAWVWRGAPPMPTSVDARGTAVESVMREWTPPMNGAAEPVNPWRGTVLTVWMLPADPAELVAWGRQLDLDGFEIKTADGASSWLDAPSRHLTRAYVEALRDGGRFGVMGWSYNYCDGLTGPAKAAEVAAVAANPGPGRFGRGAWDHDPDAAAAGARGLQVRSWDRGDGVPELEAAAAARGVRELGLDGHTFDLEVECEGHGDLVAILLTDGRRMMPGTPTAAHTWAYRSGHATYPWHEIGTLVGVVRPMCYRPTWQAATMWSDGELGPWLAGKTVAPVWGITERAATVEALRADQAVADRHGAPGVAFWERFGLPGQPGVADWIAALYPDHVVPPEPPTPEPPTDVAGLQQRAWDLCDELQAVASEFEAIGWPSTGAAIGSGAETVKGVVRGSKGER